MLKKSDIKALESFMLEVNQAVYSQYEQYQFEIEHKADGSPVTAVDLYVHDRCEAYLLEHFPDIALVSEEAYKNEKFLPANCWVLDPIDGTQELIQKTGEFCICLALVLEHRVQFGMIAIPCTAELYVGDLIHQQAYCIEGNKQFDLSKRSKKPKKILLESRFYKDEAVKNLYHQMAKKEKYQIKEIGAALKFCEVAANRAAGFLRFNETYAWDSAAGVALVQASGGKCHFINGKNIDYKLARHPGFKVEGQYNLFEV